MSANRRTLPGCIQTFVVLSFVARKTHARLRELFRDRERLLLARLREQASIPGDFDGGGVESLQKSRYYYMQ